MAKGKTIRDRAKRWLGELEEAEKALLDPEVRADPARLDALLADDLVEFGSSGRVYDKEALIEMMAGEEPAPVLIREFAVRELAPEGALVTYRTVGQSGRAVRRSSIWIRIDGRWRLVFHQGTPLPNRWGPVS